MFDHFNDLLNVYNLFWLNAIRKSQIPNTLFIMLLVICSYILHAIVVTVVNRTVIKNGIGIPIGFTRFELGSGVAHFKTH